MIDQLDSGELKQKARGLGFDLVGVCDALPPLHLDAYEKWLAKGYHGTMNYLLRQLPLKRSPQELLPGARSVIAVGINYAQPNQPVKGNPRIAMYALGRDYHKVLRGKLRRLALWLQHNRPGAKTRVCVDSAPIAERDYAQQAGLGWFGKNTCLIDSRRGSLFFIGLLLTDVPFKPDKPAVGSCGTCRKCIDACPTGAIVFEEHRWQVDARRCVSYLTIEHRGATAPNLQAGVGDWTFGCDICQEVCPFNQARDSQPERAVKTQEADFLTPREWPSLEALAGLSFEEWDRLTRGSAVRRAGYEVLKRNARINLANGSEV